MTYLTYPQLGRVGRLGNSMWELASTVGMARKLGMDPLFPPTWAYRPIFSVPDEMFGTEKGPISSDLATELDPSERPYLQHRSLWADNEDEVLGLFQPSSLAQRIINCATAVRMHIANGQPAGPAARQIGSDVMELIGELAKLSEDDKLMGWVRQPAA